MPFKLLVTLPLIALLAACVGSDPVDTESEIESTLDQDIDNDGTVSQGGVSVGVSG